MVSYASEPPILDRVVAEMMRQLTPVVEPEHKGRLSDRLTLATMVEETSALRLDPWQQHMCARLQRLTHETGQFILLHAPPQVGKSVIVSQRFPGYILGDDPTNRVRIACFNIERATKFSRIVKKVMQSRRYQSLFEHDRRLWIPNQSRNDEWSTAAREELADAQTSLKALGLQTGFVGDGVDTLIIDDPYADPKDAYSRTIRDNTWMFWDETARPRLNSQTNVIVMFHRYHQDDLAGRLIAEEGLQSQGGKWELIRYCAEWDGDSSPESGGPDPLDREIGELLSPRFDRKWAEDNKKKTLVWLSQFQGKPSNKEGGFFKIGEIEIRPAAPVQVRNVVRAWDLAASAEGNKGEPAETAGIKMCLCDDGSIGILDAVHGHWESSLRDKTIKLTAQLDHQPGPFKVKLIRFPQDPGQAGKSQIADFTIKLKGFNVKAEVVSGDKELRATPFSSYVNSGNVWMLDDGGSGWNKYMLDQMQMFPRGNLKDLVDAAADAFNELVLEDQFAPLQQFNYLNGSEDDEDSEERMLRDAAAENEAFGQSYEDDANLEGIWVNGKLHWIKKDQGTGPGTRGGARIPRVTDTASVRRAIRHPQADRNRSR